MQPGSSSNSNSGRMRYKGLSDKKPQKGRGKQAAAHEAAAAAHDFSLLMALKRLLGKHAAALHAKASVLKASCSCKALYMAPTADNIFLPWLQHVEQSHCFASRVAFI